MRRYIDTVCISLLWLCVHTRLDVCVVIFGVFVLKTLDTIVIELGHIGLLLHHDHAFDGAPLSSKLAHGWDSAAPSMIWNQGRGR